MIEEDLDDRFAGRRNQGLESRAAAAEHAVARMGVPHVDPA
jgi:hypothetical protein